MRRPWLALLLLAFALAACGASPGAGGSSAPATGAPTGAAGGPDPLLAVQLVDVTSGRTISLGSLAAQRPVLLETMAIWCTNCRSQQDQVREAHASADFTSISLDVDPNEVADDLKRYAALHGYDWHFALAGRSLAGELRDRFGTSVLNPPSTPKILLRPDGSVTALDFNRIYSAAELAALINAG